MSQISPKHLRVVKVSAISTTKTVNTHMYIFGLDVTSWATVERKSSLLSTPAPVERAATS